MIGLIVRKCGMTRLISATGNFDSVTVLEVLPNTIAQIKTLDRDGYSAVQVTYGSKPAWRVSKPLQGHYSKIEGLAAPGVGLKEFRLDDEDKNVVEGLKIGLPLSVDRFKEGQWVDIQGITKGKGFEGVMKRHGFKGQPATHGHSLSHRSGGSLGMRQSPNRVFKNKGMPGHLGCDVHTIQNSRILKIDAEKKLILVRGAVPGNAGGIVFISPSVKKSSKGV